MLAGTAGSQKRARLLRRASAGSSPKALLAAAVAVTASISLDSKVLSFTCAGNPLQMYLWGILGAQVFDRRERFVRLRYIVIMRTRLSRLPCLSEASSCRFAAHPLYCKEGPTSEAEDLRRRAAAHPEAIEYKIRMTSKSPGLFSHPHN